MRAIALIAAVLLGTGCADTCWKMGNYDGPYLQRSEGGYSNSFIRFGSAAEAIAFARANDLPLCGFPQAGGNDGRD